MQHSTPTLSAFKTCKTCGESKPLAEYGKYTSGSYRLDCKACLARKKREQTAADPQRARDALNSWRQKNREKRNADHRERIANDAAYREMRREEGRRRLAENREHIAQLRSKRYLADAERMRQYAKDSVARYPDRQNARSAVHYAVARGIFPPSTTMVCEHCQEALAASWHHHKGYSEEFKLDVIALCSKCHGKAHRKS